MSAAASEKAKGLFQKAFTFFGNPLAAYETPEVSRLLAKKLLQETSSTTMEDLLRLSSEQLKEMTQKLEMDMSSPTRDGKLIPMDIFAAYQSGVAADIEFIIGIPSNEVQVYKTVVGDEKYSDFMSKALLDILIYLDKVQPDVAKAVRNYIDEKAATMPAIEVTAKVFEQVYLLTTYQNAQKLAEAGSKIHLFYWNVKPLIENLGAGTVDVMATFLGNVKMAQMYGTILNQDIAAPIQKLFRKFASGEEMRLFPNEIKGFNAIDWKKFPQALIVSEKAFKCDSIVDKLTDVKELLKLLDE